MSPHTDEDGRQYRGHPGHISTCHFPADPHSDSSAPRSTPQDPPTRTSTKPPRATKPSYILTMATHHPSLFSALLRTQTPTFSLSCFCLLTPRRRHPPRSQACQNLLLVYLLPPLHRPSLRAYLLRRTRPTAAQASATKPTLLQSVNLRKAGVPASSPLPLSTRAAKMSNDSPTVSHCPVVLI